MKKLFALLALAALTSSLSAVIYSGDCGDNLSWTLSEDSVLTISGIGAMTDFNWDSPWSEYKDKIKYVVVEEGVTTIGATAFRDHTHMQQCSLPSTLLSIGNEAFCFCFQLTQIEIPESCTSFNGYGTFNLVPNVVIKDETLLQESGARSINGYVDGYFIYDNSEKRSLRACSSAAKDDIVLDDAIERIEYMAFAQCEDITNIHFGSNLKYIGEWSLNGCRSLEGLRFQEGLLEIGSNAFGNCFGLKYVYLPNSLITVGDFAIGNCPDLHTVHLGKSLANIGIQFLDYCQSLDTIYAPMLVPPVLDNTAFQSSDLYNIICYVPDESVSLYKQAAVWKEMNIQPESEPGPRLPANGTCGKQGDNLLWSIDTDSVLTISGNGEMINLEDIFYQGIWIDYKHMIKSVIINEGVANVGNYAFDNCKRLSSVILPNSVKRIGSYAFSYCPKITSVHFPTNLENTGDYAFLSDSALQTIVLYDNTDTIGEMSFGSCVSLTEVSLPKNMKTIADNAFNGCAFSSINIPNGTDSIGNSAFCFNHQLTNLHIPSSVSKIGPSPCWGCEKLESIIVEDANPNYTSVDGILFNKDVTTLIEYIPIREGRYEIPQTVTTIGERACSYCTKLTEVKIPKNVVTIERGAFLYCTNLVSANLPDNLTELSNGIFSYCKKLQSIQIPTTVNHIDYSAFFGCESLTTIDIPEQVSFLGMQTIAYCKGLTSIICRALTPPSMGYAVFMAVDKSIPLYVPEESVDLYKIAQQWKEFTTILPIEDTPEPIEPITDYTIQYVDKENSFIDSEIVTLHLPEPPIFSGFTFVEWQIVAGKLTDGITIQAIYQSESPTSSPSVVTNPANQAQKLIRQGNVYILCGDKNYTVTGQEIK